MPTTLIMRRLAPAAGFCLIGLLLARFSAPAPIIAALSAVAFWCIVLAMWVAVIAWPVENGKQYTVVSYTTNGRGGVNRVLLELDDGTYGVVTVPGDVLRTNTSLPPGTFVYYPVGYEGAFRFDWNPPTDAVRGLLTLQHRRRVPLFLQRTAA